MLHNSEKDFIKRHIGLSKKDEKTMLSDLGYKSLNELIEDTVPSKILFKDLLSIGDPNSEYEGLRKLKSISKKKSNLLKLYRHGLLWNLYSKRYCQKYTRKSGMVYLLHSLSTRGGPRKIGDAIKFSANDNRFYGNGYCKRITT